MHHFGHNVLEVPEGTPLPRVMWCGRDVYPIVVMSHRRIVEWVWQRLIVSEWNLDPSISGLNADEVGSRLWNAGIGTRHAQCRSKGSNVQLSNPEARQVLNEVCARYALPIVYIPQTKCFRLARSRREVIEGVRSLRRRLDTMRTNMYAVAAGELPEQLPAIKGFAPEVVSSYLELLAEGWINDKAAAVEMAERVGGNWSDTRIRRLKSELRGAGLPIIGHTHRGTRIAEPGSDDHREWLDTQAGRISEIEAHERGLRRAGILWFPVTDEEKSFARDWRRQVEQPMLPTDGQVRRRLNTQDWQARPLLREAGLPVR